MKKTVRVLMFLNTLSIVPIIILLIVNARSINDFPMWERILAFSWTMVSFYAGFYFTFVTDKVGFWSSLEELQGLIKDHKESIRQYKEAKEKLTRAILKLEE